MVFVVLLSFTVTVLNGYLGTYWVLRMGECKGGGGRWVAWLSLPRVVVMMVVVMLSGVVLASIKHEVLLVGLDVSVSCPV